MSFDNSIDNTIKHYEKLIRQNEFLIRNNDPYNFSQLEWKNKNQEYRQLIEWLKDYTRLKEQKPRKGEWLRMSEEQADDRYKCSRCGNVVHYKDIMNLYTFNSWCGRCGSDNGRHVKYEVIE